MANEEIKPEEDKAYADFVMHHIKGLVARPLPEKVFHYTTGHGLVGILESGNLRATQIACLNDAKELTHSIDELLAAIDTRRKAGVSADLEFVLTRMIEVLANPDVEVSGAFIVCFSQAEDDLSQWRAYGSGEGGYAIEFDPKALLAAMTKVNGYFIQVNYAKDKRMLLNDIVDWSEKFFLDGLKAHPTRDRDAWRIMFVQRWLQHLSALAPLIKHHKFEAEKEWRAIYMFKDRDFKRMEFIQKQTLMSRYIPLHFSDPNADDYTPLPLRRITIGPMRHKEVSRISVGDLLVKKGYQRVPGDVDVSQVPFRFA